MLGVPCVTEGVPIVLEPGEVVVVEVDGVVCVLVVPEVVVVAPGCVVVVLGDVVVLGVAVPVVCAEATPTASANTADANKTFRIEHAPLSRIAAARFSPRENMPLVSFKMRWSMRKMA